MVSRIIFVDLNSYFASVEQATRPNLLGRPVAVVPMMADTTSCLAASYPAKAYGVQTGTSVREARKRCPGIIFIEADHRKYVDYHHRIVETIERCLPVWKIFSIDEMAIRLFGREQELSFAISKALEIKKRISQDIHPALTCSIGIAPNRYIAKIASNMQKPNGLVVIRSEELPDRLFDLSLRDFPGIGARMEERLVEARCFNARILCQKSSSELHQLWGSKVGDDFWRLIHGEEVEERPTNRASLSHSRVLPPDNRNPERAWSNLVMLTSKAAMRLRQEGFYTRCLHLHLKFLHRGIGPHHWEAKTSFLETQNSIRLLRKLELLWMQAPQQNILKVGIVMSALVPFQKHQLSLFEDEKHNKLMVALDILNTTHRKNLVVFSGSIELRKTSHAPIAFQHIPKKYE